MAALTLTPSPWTDQAAASLAPLAETVPGGLPLWRSDVLAQRMTLWAAELGGECVGWALTRLDDGPAGREWWIIAATGGAPRTPIAPACLAAFETHARGLGCARVIWWTQRTGLAALARAAGYRLHTVCEKELTA